MAGTSQQRRGLPQTPFHPTKGIPTTTMMNERVRVLIAEDEEEIRNLVQRWLRLHGRFEIVAIASDGLEAAALAEIEKPDVVVMDLDMPRMAGDAAILEIRRRAPATKIVVFSGTNPNEEDLVRRGADLVLVKARALLSELPERVLALFAD